MKFKSMLCVSSCLFFGLANAEKPENTSQADAVPLVPQVRSAVKFDVSLPMHMMIPKPIVAKDKRGGSIIDPGPVSNDSDQGYVQDGALQSVMGGLPGPIKQNDFFALDNISGVSPPDPAGDVGPNHYVAMTNLSYAVLDKSGTLLYGPAANNTVWTGFGGACENENSGDPIVLYDQISDRWLLSQFTSAGPDYYNCVALSTTPDPTGTYYRWAIRNNGSGSDLFPDYPKYGVWSDGFYISTRDFDSGYAGVGVYALKRDDIVGGNPNPTIIYFFVDRSTDPWQVGDGLLPADIDGSTLPPAGSPQYFVGSMDDGGPYGAAQDGLTFWEFDADFDTPANSTFTRTAIIPIASYDTQYPCTSGRNCIPQAGTSNGIDIQSYRQRPLHRLAYRNFGTHESLVTNQSVEASAALGGIRWWEIRDPDNSPTLHQEGTYAPGVNDGIHRWMGSIAMDQEGNMGLAYSASSSSMNPAIRFTGRLATDPLGAMDRTEGSIIDGTGSQTGSQRWGDYTSTNVDPVDDCTFWHVNEYYDSDGGDWQIRVGSFKFDECGDPGFTLSSPDSEMAICAGDDVSYDINVGSIGQYDGVVTLTNTGEPAGTVASFTTNPIPSLPGSTVFSITNTGLVTSGPYTINVAGTSPTVDPKDIDLMLQVYDAVPSTPTLVSPADGAMNQDTQPSLNWTGSDTIEYTVEVATDMAFSNIVFSGNTTGNTIAPTTDLDTSTTFYWRVIANNSCGDSMYSQVFSFTTLAAPGDCSIGQVPNVLYEYDFESGLNGWSSDSNLQPPGSDVWTESGVRTHSGVASMLAVNVSNVSDQILTSPPVAIPSGQQPVSLSFWNHQTLEDRTSGCYDGGILEISTDNGVNFTQIDTSNMLTDPYDGPVDDGYSNPLANLDAWCGDPQDWLNSVVDLADYEGETAIFRFRLGTDSLVSREGWYIDDVKVQSCLPDGPTYSVGGMVTGLEVGNSVTLQNNNGDDLTVNGDGSFTFVTELADGFNYNVTVSTQPTSPNQTCTVTNEMGTISSADVTDVTVTCVINTHTVGGTVTGLEAGNSVSLQNNSGDDLTINADGSFTFATALDDGSNYTVTVLTQPTQPDQVCSITNDTGMISGADVTDVAVDCVTTCDPIPPVGDPDVIWFNGFQCVQTIAP